MKKPFAVGIILTAACFLCRGALVFPQASSKSTKTLLNRKQPNPSSGQRGTATTAYVVKKGDSLYGIANAHGTTVAALKSVNNLRSSRLQIGQKLRLSASRDATAKPPGTSDPSRQVRKPEPSGSPAAASDELMPENTLAGASSSLEEGEFFGISPSEGDPDSNVEPAQQPLRLRLASAGIGFLGVRYRWNGNSARSGFDCSGLVKCLFEKFNISLPRSSREQYKVGEKVDKDKLEVGDLVFFASRSKTPSHVGVYIGDNKFLHAARRAKRVLISNLTAAWYSKRFLGARRLSDLWEPDPKPAETKSN